MTDVRGNADSDVSAHQTAHHGIRTITGSVVLTNQLLTDALSHEQAMGELEWIAQNYDIATPSQRARWDRFETALHAREDAA